MKFGLSQIDFFNTEYGTYSIVTERENYDSQITTTDEETVLLYNYFGKQNIHVGNVSSNREKAIKEFRLYPNGEKIALNLVFPKPHKTELRLYLSQRAGFKPDAGNVWFMFVSGAGEIWIGALSELSWRLLSKGITDDDSDFLYQNTLNKNDLTGDIRKTTIGARDVYARDRRIALQQMAAANYMCEFNSSHPRFISNATKKPYVEAHHLIPISLQQHFNISLDNQSNIYCLCPNCHRAIHHAESDYKREIIDTLVSRRPDVLGMVNGDLSEIHNFYSVEYID